MLKNGVYFVMFDLWPYVINPKLPQKSYLRYLNKYITIILGYIFVRKCSLITFENVATM